MEGRSMEEVHDAKHPISYADIEPGMDSKLLDNTAESYHGRHLQYQHLPLLGLPAKLEHVDERAYHTIPAVHISHAQYSQMEAIDQPISIPTCMSSVEMGPEMSVAVDTFVNNVVAANEQTLLEQVEHLEKEANMGSVIHSQDVLYPMVEKLQGVPLIVPQVKQTDPRNGAGVAQEGHFIASRTVITPLVEQFQPSLSTVTDQELLNLHICEKTYDNYVDQNDTTTPLKPYKCGGCSINFDTICVLHDHLQTHIDGGSYHYDHFFKTAFPKCDTFCQYVQTDAFDFGREDITEIVQYNVSVNECDVSSNSRKSKRKLGNPRKCIQEINVDRNDKSPIKASMRTKDRKAKGKNIYMMSHEIRETRKHKLKVSQGRTKVNKLEVTHSLPNMSSKDLKQSKKSGKAKGTKSKATDNKPKVKATKSSDKNSKRKSIETTLTCEDSKSKHIDKPKDLDMYIISISEEMVKDTDYTCMSNSMDMDNDSDCAHEEMGENHFDSDTDDNEMTGNEELTKELVNENIFLLENENKENASAIHTTQTLKNPADIKMEPIMADVSGISKPFKKRGQPRKSENVESALVKQDKKLIPGIKAESITEGDVLGTDAGVEYEHNKDAATCYEDKKKRKERCGPLPRFKECETCGETMARYKYINHIRQHTGEKPFVCEKCGKAFARNRFLTKHLITHEDVKPWKCHLCPASFCQKNEFKMHLAGHTGYRPHKCNVCDASFLSKTTMQTHVANIHMGETRFECQVCNRRFFKKSSLKIHVATHFEATFKCGFCDKMFKDRSGLKRHERIHTGVKMFKCHICNHAFIQSTPFWAHMEKRHNLGRSEVKAYRRDVNLMMRDSDTVFRPSREDSLPVYKVQAAETKMVVKEVETRELKSAREILTQAISYTSSDIIDAGRDVDTPASISRHAVTDSKLLQYEDNDQSKLLHRAIAHQLHNLVDAANPSSPHMLHYTAGKPYEYTIDQNAVGSPVPETAIPRQALPPIGEAVSSRHQLQIPVVTIGESDLLRHQYTPAIYQIPSTMPEHGSSSPAPLNIGNSKQLHYADAENNSLHSLYHNPLMFVANLASAYPSDISASNDTNSMQHVVSYSKI